MASDRPTKPPPRRSSQRLVAMPGTSARVEVAAELVARIASQAQRARVVAALDAPLDRLPIEALEPIRALINEMAASARQQVATVVRAYAAELHARYAEALHAVRPGAELEQPNPSLDNVLTRLADAGIETSREELAAICRTIGLDVIEPDEPKK